MNAMSLVDAMTLLHAMSPVNVTGPGHAMSSVHAMSPLNSAGPAHTSAALPSPALLTVAIAALAAGTFAFRYAGPALRSRVRFPPAAEKLLERSAVVLLTALVCTTALYEAQQYAGLARPLGVAVGGVLAWRRAPFLAVALAAVGSTALLRWAGVP